MKVLVACEESQEVTKSFRKRGHEAFSCDILPCSGGYPEWHRNESILDGILNEGWDLMIAHPPCTHLSVSGARWFKYKTLEQAQALDFVSFLFSADIQMIDI